MNLEQNKIKRYIRLDQILRDSNGYTLNEILDDEQMDYISKRSLRDNLNEFEVVFGAVFDDSPNAYRGRERLWKYKDSNFSIFNQINKDVEIIRNTIEKLKCFEGDPRYDYIRFFLLDLENGVQKNCNLMSFNNNMEYLGLENIESLAQAIIHKYPIKLVYKPFNGKELEINVHPYHLRQYNQRWYLFAYTETKREIYNYPLDRIVSVEHLSKAYIPTDINFDEHFDDIVGTTNLVEKQVEKIILRVSKFSFDYIRTKPMHWSQTVLKNTVTDTTIDIQLKVKQNKELEMLILSFGNAIEVIEPMSLRNKIKDIISGLYSKYLV